jgi:hypothetical protein
MTELPAGRTIRLNDTEYTFSVAETALELMRGLKGVASLGSYDGMLFDFGCDFQPIMTPKGILFDLDVAFITAEGEIVEIKRLVAEQLTQASTRRDIRYALEVPVNWFEENNVNIGDYVDFS